jgi:hypothetical protein
MVREPPESVQQAIDRFNEDLDQTRDILAMADWPTPGEVFEVEYAGVCGDCQSPEIQVVEPGAEASPVSLVTRGCISCDLYEDIDNADAWSLADDGDDPLPN